MRIRNFTRNTVRRHLLPACGVRRIHIIGCARSGTTMLHYAMIAFENTLLCEIESGIRAIPSMEESLKLAWKALRTRQPIVYITKRNYGWFENAVHRQTVEYILKEKIGIINLIRDPRDVLVSKHAGADDNDEYYVTPQRWKQSIDAGSALIEKVHHRVPTLTLRYEDLIQDSAKVEQSIGQTFGLTKRRNMGPLASLRDNLERIDLSAEDWMTEALHEVRNFDDRSIAVWDKFAHGKNHIDAILSGNNPYSDAIRDFLVQYEYSNPVVGAASSRDRTLRQRRLATGTHS